MSVSADLQTMLASRLGEAGRLRIPVPIVARREKDLTAEIEAAAAKGAGLCAFVMPSLPTSVINDMPFVFVDRSEVRVRLVEQPALNASGVSAWNLADDVATALQWHYASPLAHPLQLAPAAIETASDKQTLIVDVLFTATYQLPRRNVPAVAFTPAGLSAADDLQAAVLAQLVGSMVSPGVPTMAVRDHDQASEIERAGHPIKVEVMPPRPARAMQGVDFVFFESWEVRVSITEEPAFNESGVDVYDLVEDVATSLHWQPFAGFLAYPLQLASRPTELKDDLNKRQIDVIFNAALGFDPEDE